MVTYAFLDFEFCSLMLMSCLTIDEKEGVYVTV